MPPERESIDAALQVCGATRRLAGRDVLRGVTIDVAHGAIVALVGPNGAGKSSLLRAVGGRLALDAGTMRIAGRDAADARRAGRLGIVPQDIALHAHLSVRENLRLWAVLAGTPKGDVTERIRAGLDDIGLADRATTRVDRLSGGMRRRVNVLAGLLHRPALLLLDEPTVGVDDESRARLWTVLRRRRAEGIGVLLATHDLEEAAALCDAVAVLHHGAVVAAGTVADLMTQFGGPSGEVVVQLAATPAEIAFERLTTEGFRRIAAGEWVRPVAGPHVDLADLDRRLGSMGVDVTEVRYRRPTLQGAVAAAIGRSGEARP